MVRGQNPLIHSYLHCLRQVGTVGSLGKGRCKAGMSCDGRHVAAGAFFGGGGGRLFQMGAQPKAGWKLVPVHAAITGSFTSSSFYISASEEATNHLALFQCIRWR